MQDRDVVIQDMLSKRQQYIDNALAVFHEADSDNSGQVSYAEFEDHLSDPRVQAFFQCMELDAVEARRLFRLLDLDQNGQVSPQEFVAGCVCLKGAAKTMDMAALLLEVRRISESFSEGMGLIDDRIRQLETNRAMVNV